MARIFAESRSFGTPAFARSTVDTAFLRAAFQTSRSAEPLRAAGRNAEIDADRIVVESNNGIIVLKGTVRSWAEREEAERAAWAAPGVAKVENRIVVSP